MTETEQKAAYFGNHINCEVEYNGSTFTLVGVITETLTINHNGDYVHIPKNSAILSGDFSGVGHGGVDFVPISKCQLVQRSLSSITDDECIEVAKIVYPGFNKSDNELRDLGRSIIDHLRNKESGVIRWSLGFELIDYLRSRSFALPFRGISVDELINRGWLKLRKEGE